LKKDQVAIAVIASLITSIIGFVFINAVGLLEKEVKTDQISKVAESIVDNESLRTELLGELEKRTQAKVDDMSSAVRKLDEAIGPTETWPHAINCGASSWQAIFVLHGSPARTETISGMAWYVQVYPEEYRYVRFNADGTYKDRAGHSDSNIGCQGLSIRDLRQKGRTFRFVSEG